MKIILKKSMPILFSVLSLLIATVNADCPSGIVSYWKLDETTGSIAEDSVGIYNGTMEEGTWTNGKVNNGIYFNGIYDSGYITAGNELSMDNSFTLEAWVKPDEDITNQDREIILRGHCNYDISDESCWLYNYVLDIWGGDIRFGFYAAEYQERTYQDVNDSVRTLIDNTKN